MATICGVFLMRNKAGFALSAKGGRAVVWGGFSTINASLSSLKHLTMWSMKANQWVRKSQWKFLESKESSGASLVAQWLRIHLPMQGTRVRALVREDPTCHGATKRVHHNYWACALDPVSHNYWAHEPQLLKPARLEPMLRNKRSHRNEKPAGSNEDPTQPKIKTNKLIN